jgi:hypothetical protein
VPIVDDELTNNNESQVLDDAMTSDTTALDDNENEESSEEENFDEIRVSAPSANELVAQSSQVMDYQLRPKIFDNISVWDFVTSFRKTTIKRRKTCKLNNLNLDENLDSYDSENENLMTENVNMFLDGHLEHHSHQVVARPHKLVAVPIGPSLPFRDRSETYAKYCRIMLLLFKPWRNATDLRNQGDTWIVAFEIFKNECSSNIITLMNNMQLLHECRENGHDHYERLQRSRQIPTNYKRPSTTTLDDFGQQDNEAILEHLEAISSCNSQNVARSLSNVLDCVISAEASGMYDTSNSASKNSNHVINTSLIMNDLEEILIRNQDFSLEEHWKNEYDIRRDKWKQHTTNDIKHPVADSINNSESTDTNVVSDGSEMRHALQNNSHTIPMATDPGQLSFQGPTFDNRATSRLCRVTSHNKQCPR